MYEFVKLDDVYYAGSHGMDIMGPSMQLDSYEFKYQKQSLDKKVQFLAFNWTHISLLTSLTPHLLFLTGAGQWCYHLSTC